MTWIVAGLGNPGERYAATRHNLGYRVVDELGRRAGERFKKVRFVPVELAEITDGAERLLLGKSQRFYNEAGEVYASLARKRDVAPDHVIAVHDDLDLALGALRLKLGGSTAGNHGLDSLVRGLRTPDFYRVRLGIGRPPGRQDPVDFVLEPFPKRAEADVAILVDDAADAVLSLARDGLATAQDRYNRAGPRT
jgi:peptidyl-tRNA hydrolase, PTH1 family